MLAIWDILVMQGLLPDIRELSEFYFFKQYSAPAHRLVKPSSCRHIRLQTSFQYILATKPPWAGWASECPNVKNYKWRLNPVWHRMLYTCTHMETVGVKGLRFVEIMYKYRVACFLTDNVGYRYFTVKWLNAGAYNDHLVDHVVSRIKSSSATEV